MYEGIYQQFIATCLYYDLRSVKLLLLLVGKMTKRSFGCKLRVTFLLYYYIYIIAGFGLSAAHAFMQSTYRLSLDQDRFVQQKKK